MASLSPKKGRDDVNVPNEIEDWIISVGVTVGAAVVGSIKWIVSNAVKSVVQSQEDHEKRLLEIERNFVTREDLKEVSLHIDRNFDRVHSRLDEIFNKKLSG